MLPSQTVENYLKTIYLAQAELKSADALVPMGQLASALGVVPGTATTMVKALSESGLVKYEPYMGVRLTPAGEALLPYAEKLLTLSQEAFEATREAGLNKNETATNTEEESNEN